MRDGHADRGADLPVAEPFVVEEANRERLARRQRGDRAAEEPLHLFALGAERGVGGGVGELDLPLLERRGEGVRPRLGEGSQRHAPRDDDEERREPRPPAKASQHLHSLGRERREDAHERVVAKLRVTACARALERRADRVVDDAAVALDEPLEGAGRALEAGADEGRVAFFAIDGRFYAHDSIHGIPGTAELAQHKEVWGYPFEREEDHSNTQYALLGLGAARRLGMDVPLPGLQRALDHFLKAQEQDGTDFEPRFVVPAADHTARECEQLAADLHKPKVRQEGGSSAGFTEIRKFYDTAAKEKMRARGFGYKTEDDEDHGRGGKGGGNGGGGRGGWGRGRRAAADLSMTCAGLASLVTLKWALEGTPNYPAKKVDQAIRDAAAYIAKNFRVAGEGDHDYYILYGLERAGAMTGCPFFGTHDWYVEGGEWILDQQNQDGSWGKAGPISGQIIGAPETSLPNTCFALLFLKRGSVPVAPPIPKRIATGDSRGGEEK